MSINECYFVVCEGRRVACRWTYEEACDWMTQISLLSDYAVKDLYIRKGRID